MAPPGLYLHSTFPKVQQDPKLAAARRYWYAQAERERMCKFCKENGEPIEQYTSHRLRDNEGLVTCPVLRSYNCELCGATGDNAHTRSYCPKKPKNCYNATIFKRTQFSAAGIRRK